MQLIIIKISNVLKSSIALGISWGLFLCGIFFSFYLQDIMLKNLITALSIVTGLWLTQQLSRNHKQQQKHAN